MPSLTTLSGRFGCWWVEEFDLDTRVDLGLTNYCIGLITNLFIPTQMVIFPWFPIQWWVKLCSPAIFWRPRAPGPQGPGGPPGIHISPAVEAHFDAMSCSGSGPCVHRRSSRSWTWHSARPADVRKGGEKGGIEAAPEIWGHFLGGKHVKNRVWAENMETLAGNWRDLFQKSQ